MPQSHPLANAPGILGAFAFMLLLPSCKEKPPAWEGESVSAESACRESQSRKAAPKAKPSAAEPNTASDSSQLRFVVYNLENWLSMDRYVDRKPAGTKSKPESECEAIVTILARARPDVIGICEIGTSDDLADLQNRLKAAGIDLPHAHHTGGVDPTRHLALLSRYPISATTPKDLNYQLEDKTRGMSRGILDATVQAPQGKLRFLGVHLKSKREIPEADQEMMRRAEAHLLRRQADQILSADPTARLIVYGDMNDIRQSSAIRTIKGPKEGPKSLKMAWLKDSRGEDWTHHWSYQSVYSRFDYIFISRPLLKSIEWDDCLVIDDDEWEKASDHRPLLFIIK